MIDSLTLDQMRVLVAVADAGSFSAAARKVGRVQSAISQSIQTLETTLGLVLFDRSGKTPRLTDAGKALVNDSRALIAGAQAIRARAQSMAEDVEPELTLAVDSTNVPAIKLYLRHGMQKVGSKQAMVRDLRPLVPRHAKPQLAT